MDEIVEGDWILAIDESAFHLKKITDLQYSDRKIVATSYGLDTTLKIVINDSYLELLKTLYDKTYKEGIGNLFILGKMNGISESINIYKEKIKPNNMGKELHIEVCDDEKSLKINNNNTINVMWL